jgi:hypothetical protein
MARSMMPSMMHSTKLPHPGARSSSARQARTVERWPRDFQRAKYGLEVRVAQLFAQLVHELELVDLVGVRVDRAIDHKAPSVDCVARRLGLEVSLGQSDELVDVCVEIGQWLGCLSRGAYDDA